MMWISHDIGGNYFFGCIIQFETNSHSTSTRRMKEFNVVTQVTKDGPEMVLLDQVGNL